MKQGTNSKREIGLSKGSGKGRIHPREKNSGLNWKQRSDTLLESKRNLSVLGILKSRKS